MALGQCPECGGKVASSANACPHCGHVVQPSQPQVPQKESTSMGVAKGIIIAVVVLGVAGAGCCLTPFFSVYMAKLFGDDTYDTNDYDVREVDSGSAQKR